QDNGRIGVSIQTDSSEHITLQHGDEISITRLTAIVTSRDTSNLHQFSEEILDQLQGKTYIDLLAESKHVWDELWNDFDVEIEGDEYAQLAIRFVSYHLLIAAPRHDDRVSIGAKSLSGAGYKGHVFWDTELFMLPPFILSRPEIARNLLMYRYHNLEGARKKAAEAGYKGAMFPWESTDTGEETTPRWTLPDKDGKRIRIWTGDHEQHISSDIAFAIWLYWQWTGDDDFMRDYGAEIFLDTAVFWASRVEWNKEQNRYELNLQIGPDEFHENINNSVYTNTIVAWHVRHAPIILNWLQHQNAAKYEQLRQLLNIDDTIVDKWNDIADKMYIPRHEALGVYEQFNGYFDLNYIDVEAYTPRTTSLDTILGHENTVKSQVIKQADVIMMIALFGEQLGDREELLRNWRIYVPRTAHDSSLSSAIHAWVAARLGLEEEAYDLWIKSAAIDLDNTKGNVQDGIHAAACGGLRQAIIFGFAGLQLDDNSPQGWTLHPQLPKWWKSIKFSFYYHGQKHTVTVE
ncbi:MAG: beta-phosphoglucomutase, partial [Phototrophicales bacterium]